MAAGALDGVELPPSRQRGGHRGDLIEGDLPGRGEVGHQEAHPRVHRVGGGGAADQREDPVDGHHRFLPSVRGEECRRPSGLGQEELGLLDLRLGDDLPVLHPDPVLLCGERSRRGHAAHRRGNIIRTGTGRDDAGTQKSAGEEYATGADEKHYQPIV